MATIFERCEHERGTSTGKVVTIKATIVRRNTGLGDLSPEERKERKNAAYRRWYERNKEKAIALSKERYYKNKDIILQTLKEQREAERPAEAPPKRGYVKTNKIFKKEAAALAAALKDIKLVTLNFLLSNFSLQV